MPFFVSGDLDLLTFDLDFKLLRARDQTCEFGASTFSGS